MSLFNNKPLAKKIEKLDSCLRSKDHAKIADAFSMLHKSAELMSMASKTKPAEVESLMKTLKKDLKKLLLTKTEMKRVIESCPDEFIDLQVAQREHAIKMLTMTLEIISTTIKNEKVVNKKK